MSPIRQPEPPTEPQLLEQLIASDNSVALIAELSRTAVQPVQLRDGEVIHRLIPEGFNGVVEEFPEWLRDRPRRKDGEVTVHDAESFLTYVNRHVTHETTVWINDTEGQVVAVLDDHEPEDQGGGAGWAAHRCNLHLRKTPEWAHWTGRDGQLLEQEAFAEHIDQGLLEVIEPDGAQLLEIAQTFHATTSAQFRSGIRLSDGNVQFLYDEETEAKAGRSGQLQIPATFELAIAPFIGEDAQRITADLRYRVRGGKLAIGYRLRRPHEVIELALTQLRARLAGADLVVVNGLPR